MKFLLVIFFFISLHSFPQTGKFHIPVPTKAQLAWHEMEFYLFANFGPNTFTDKEWGEGIEPEDIFNPTNLDCRQWCRIAKAAGAKGIIITAKHHDGFCLWPSKYSTHTVRESKWKNGKGDVLRELSQACKEYGLKFGVYISPWDRNHPDYGTEKYNDVFVNMMKEIIQNYGPIWELWWDGANGEGPNGKKQNYDWKKFENTVRRFSPQTIIFSDIGPDIRWGVNEKDSAALTGFKHLRDESFGENLLKEADTYYEFSSKDFSEKPMLIRGFDSPSSTYGINMQNFIVQLKQPAKTNCIVLREAIHLGQRIRRFSVVLYKDDKAVGQILGTSVGRKRILTFPAASI